MNLIEKSMQIALRAYAGKTDKAGREYILHPLRVMVKMTTDLEMSPPLCCWTAIWWRSQSALTSSPSVASGMP